MVTRTTMAALTMTVSRGVLNPQCPCPAQPRPLTYACPSLTEFLEFMKGVE